MELLIRKVNIDDAESVVSVLNPIIATGLYTVFDTPLRSESEREYIGAFSLRGVFFVAECLPQHQVVGWQSMEPFATYTHAFDHVGVIGTFVDLAQRRRGVGTRLSAATFEAARRKRYEKVFTYVRADNWNSLAFHLKLGFRIVGTAQRQARLGGRYIDEVIIEKFL